MVESIINGAGVGGMVEAALLIERKTFEEMVRFVMKAMREGIPEEEIWATSWKNQKGSVHSLKFTEN